MATDALLPFDDDPAPPDPLLVRDAAAREFAVNPAHNVVLEASAGTGKTWVLVTRYVNLLRAGVDPANILAITFTRKAAAEMRERVVRELRALAPQSPQDAERWRDLRDRLGEIGISTIDAFCLSLLREFPLEADLDPGFQVADETETARLSEEALDAALRAGRRLAARDQDVALLVAALGERRVRSGLSALLGRRLATRPAIRRFLGTEAGLAPVDALERAATGLAAAIESAAGSVDGFLADGPGGHPAFELLAADLREASGPGRAIARGAFDRMAGYFLTRQGAPRKRLAPPYRKSHCPSEASWKRHSALVAAVAPQVEGITTSLDRSLNRAMARAASRLLRIAVSRYRMGLEAQASVDFTESLERTLALLRRMDEFSQSRYRLEARYHHVLVDEFQDTSRAQWKLVSRLVESWGEGAGLAHDAPLQPSVFVVGDRKQSIYAFRDADVGMLRRARSYIGALRPGGDVRRSIVRSFRAAPALLGFTNSLFGAIDKAPVRADAFRYSGADRFPAPPVTDGPPAAGALGIVAAESTDRAAAGVAMEIDRLLRTATVRDRQSATVRAAEPGDVAVLFRSRESHRAFESALEALGIRTYVYKGLGFFDADEVKDLVALLRYLAEPSSDLRAAAFLRSRFVRLSDVAIRRLAPSFAGAITATPGAEACQLPPEDARALGRLRAALPGWLALVDRLPPAEVLDRILDESAYACEVSGPREAQARENVKKVRALIRRMQNRGYATLPRIAAHLDRLSAGDESNAVVDAAGAVNLMTVHAAKGLEFPIVFVVNLDRGTGGRAEPILVVEDTRRPAPLVSVAGGLPEADVAVRERDIEETKRLLYVAVTRARERLYLSATVKDGRFEAGRGSLGEVMPKNLREVIARAAAGGVESQVSWQAPDGAEHGFRACPSSPPDVSPVSARQAAPSPVQSDVTRAAVPSGEPREEPDSASPSDFGPWRDDPDALRVSVTARAAGLAAAERSVDRDDQVDRATRRMAGTLVHRLFQAFDSAVDTGPAEAAARARCLLSVDERAEVEDLDSLIEEAAATFLALRHRPDVSVLLDSAACLYEVPFSLRPDAEDAAGQAIVRGTIDCLARRPDGGIVIVEIKTGRPRNWHRAQLDLYLRAARALWPGSRIEGTILYSECNREPDGSV